MTIKETIESLQLLLMHIANEGEEEKRTYIDDVKPSSTIFVLSTAIDILQEAKEAEPVRHGRWIDSPVPNNNIAKCSLCGFWQKTNGEDKTGNHMIHKAVYRYCAGCGARMDGGAEMDKCYMCHADIIDGVNNRSRFHIGSISGREKFPVCDSCFQKWTDTVHSGVQAAIERGKEEPVKLIEEGL